MFYVDNSGQMTLFEEKLRKNKFTKKEGGGGCEKEEGGGGGCEKEEGEGGSAEVEAMDPEERRVLDEREENMVLGPAEDDVELHVAPKCDQKMEPKSLSKGKSDSLYIPTVYCIVGT